MDPHEFLDGATVRVASPTYAVCRSTAPAPDAFAVVRDDAEPTVVVEQPDGVPEAATDVSPDWRLLSFDLELPFDLVGFMAVVAGALAEVDVSVFVLSSYSTDHLLVGNDDLDTAARRLDALGCDVVRPK